MWNITETPWLLLIVGGIVFGIVMMVRQAIPDKQRWWQLAIPAAIFAMSFGLDYFIRTDREKIEAIFGEAKRMAIKQDFSRFNEIFSPDYQDSRNATRDDLRQFCRLSLAMTSLNSVRIRSWDLSILDDEAESEIRLRVWIHYRGEEMEVQTPYWVRIRVNFARNDRNWQITTTEIVSVNDDPMGWREVP